MQAYGIPHRELLALPMKTFWLLNQNIDRIFAQRDMRTLTVAVSGQSQEAAKGYRETLIAEVGVIVKFKESSVMDAERDEQGFAELKAIASKMM